MSAQGDSCVVLQEPSDEKVCFGRVLWWHEQTWLSLVCSWCAITIVVGSFWILHMAPAPIAVASASVSLQSVQIDSGLSASESTGGEDSDGVVRETLKVSLTQAATEIDDAEEVNIPLLGQQTPVIQPESKPDLSNILNTPIKKAASSFRSTDPMERLRELLPGGDNAGMGSDGSFAQDGDEREAAQFFGLGADGARSVVYVIDCSGSMDEPKAKFLLAKRELAASIRSLNEDQKFHVIFFCNHPIPMPTRKLLFGNDDNKHGVIRWIKGMSIHGGTNPGPAMQQALALRPEVIYFLSDGEFPVRQCKEVENLNQYPQSTIYTIGFGDRTGEPQMIRLASESGGQYRFVDFGR